MEEDYAFLDQIAYLTGTYDWAARAEAEGAEMSTTEDGLLRIKKKWGANDTEGPAMRTADADMYSEEIVDPYRNLLIGSKLYDGGGELLCLTVYKYRHDEASGQWQPEIMYYEEHDTDEVTGSAYISKTTYYYENYSLQTN